jgi:LuxR family maltose regulon positive regulatory protein
MLDEGPLDMVVGELSSTGIRPSSPSQGMLEGLERANLFLVPLDYERGWYRYHHLFQELLRHRLRVVLSEEEINSLHRRASAWHAGQRYDEEALGHALAAGDVLGSVRLVESRRVDLFNREDWHTLERWLKRLTEETVRTRPELLIAQAQVLLNRFNLPAAMPLLTEAEVCLEQDESLPEDERLVLQAEMAALLSPAMYFSGDVERTLATTERALQHLPLTHSFWRGLALDFHCLALQATGRMEIAVRMLNKALSDEAAPVSHRNQAFIGLCFVYLAAGNLRQMRQTAELFREFGVKSDHLPAVADANYFAGLAHYEWNELKEAAARFLEVIASRHQVHFISVYFSMLGLIKTELGLGKLDASQAAIDKLRAYALETGNTQYMPEIDFLQWRHFILKDDIVSASQGSPSVPTDTPPTPLMFYEDVHLKQAQFRLAQADKAELSDTVAHLEQQLDEVDQKHGTLRSIQILAHLALAHQKMGQANKALEYLEQSVVRGQGGGFIRTFVDLGPEMAHLLRQLAKRGVAPDYVQEPDYVREPGHVRRILAAFPKTRATPEAIRAIRQDAQAALVEPLTERELEVLQLLGRRLSDQEIAQTLSISVLTAKTHARNIYQKLGVSGRRQAVAKARSLGILL